MEMRQRHLGALVLAGALAVSVAGCGSDDEPASTAAGTSGSAGCDASKPFKIGHPAPLTGPSADLGKLVQDGADIAAAELNEGKGILGRCVQVITKDDAGDPTKSTQVTRELVDQEEVSLLIGPVLSSPTAASLEVTNRAQMPQMVISSLSAASVAKNFPYSFMDEFTQAQSVDAIVAYMKRQGYQRPAALAVNNALGTYYGDAFPKAVAAAGYQLAAPIAFNQTGALDLTAQLGPLLQSKPDVLVVFEAAGPDNAAVVRARNQLAPDLPVIGLGAMANVAATGALKSEEMKGVVSGPFSRNFGYVAGTDRAVGDRAQAFLERFRQYRKTDTLTVSAAQAASAYDQVMNAAAAVNGAGKVDGDAVKEWLESHPVEGSRTTYRWTAESHAGHPLDEAAYVEAASLKNGILQLAQGETS